MMAGRGSTAAVGGPARHIPVMLSEVLAQLDPKDGEIIVDGTFGAGGYSQAILESADCKIIAIDRDPEAFRLSGELATAYPGRVLAVLGRYSEMVELAASEGFSSVGGVVLDLGVSSMQLDEPARGFSFSQDGPLDMRMGQGGPSARDIVNSLGEQELAEILFKLGEERRVPRHRQGHRQAARRGADRNHRGARRYRRRRARAHARREEAPRHPHFSGLAALSQRGARRARPRPLRRRASAGSGRPACRRHLSFARGPDCQAVLRQPERAAAARLAPSPGGGRRNSCPELPAS